MDLNLQSSYESARHEPGLRAAMDRRCETREASARWVTVTNLPTTDSSIPGHLVDISESGIGLILAWPLKLSECYAVEWGDVIMIADVVHCSDAGGYYHVGLKTSYIIIDRTGDR